MTKHFATPAILASRGGALAVALGGRLFRKEILRAGETWIHPTTGQIVAFTPAELQALAAESNAYAASQEYRIPFPDGHVFTAEANLGHWKGFSVEGGRLIGTVEAGDEKVAEKLGGRIRDVSAWIESGMRDAKGKTYGPAIRHVCATPEPVIHGSNFEPVALSRDGAPVPVYVPTTKENRPMLKKLIAALALSADATEEAVLAEVAKLKATPAPEVTALSARASAAEAHVVALSAKVATLETEKAEREKSERESSIAEVVALAAKAGKPDAFTADDQKLVRDNWSSSPAVAKRLLSLARSTIGAPEKVDGAVVAAQPVDKVALAKQAEDRLAGAVALARASGAEIQKDASGTYAVRADGVKVKLG